MVIGLYCAATAVATWAAGRFRRFLAELDEQPELPTEHDCCLVCAVTGSDPSLLSLSGRHAP